MYVSLWCLAGSVLFVVWFVNVWCGEAFAVQVCKCVSVEPCECVSCVICVSVRAKVRGCANV